MSEIGEIKTAIALMDSMIRSGEDHSERSLAILTEAREQLDALTTGSCDMSFRVKPLEWGLTRQMAEAYPVVGSVYRIVRSSSGGYNCNKGGLSSRSVLTHDGRSNHATTQDAKDAAQADYERLILSALEQHKGGKK